MDLGLKGKVALVTGASKGLGKAIAEELAKEGANISICARGKHDLQQTAEGLRGNGIRVLALSTDVTHSEDTQTVIDRTVQEFAMECTCLSMRRHYVETSQNSRLFAAFGVFSRDRP